MTESSNTATDDSGEEQITPATAGPGGFLAETAEKDDHESFDEAAAAVGEHHPQDVTEVLEDFPNATAGPAEFLTLTTDLPTEE